MATATTTEQLIAELISRTGKSIRVGISGVPGVGKSTLIEALGNDQRYPANINSRMPNQRPSLRGLQAQQDDRPTLAHNSTQSKYDNTSRISAC